MFASCKAIYIIIFWLLFSKLSRARHVLSSTPCALFYLNIYLLRCISKTVWESEIERESAFFIFIKALCFFFIFSQILFLLSQIQSKHNGRRSFTNSLVLSGTNLSLSLSLCVCFVEKICEENERKFWRYIES